MFKGQATSFAEVMSDFVYCALTFDTTAVIVLLILS